MMVRTTKQIIYCQDEYDGFEEWVCLVDLKKEIDNLIVNKSNPCMKCGSVQCAICSEDILDLLCNSPKQVKASPLDLPNGEQTVFGEHNTGGECCPKIGNIDSDVKGVIASPPVQNPDEMYCKRCGKATCGDCICYIQRKCTCGKPKAPRGTIPEDYKYPEKYCRCGGIL